MRRGNVEGREKETRRGHKVRRQHKESQSIKTYNERRVKERREERIW